MGKVFCANCGNQNDDTDKFCVSCGAPVKLPTRENVKILEAPKVEQVNSIVEENSITDAEIQQAREELKELNKKENNYVIVGGILLGLGFLACCFKIYGLGVLLGIAGLVSFVMITQLDEPIKHARNKAQGKRFFQCCPICNSNNISASTMQTGTTTNNGTIRVSKNINPTHPFTHTNIKASPTTTVNNYQTVYKCGNCGKTFLRPREMFK